MTWYMGLDSSTQSLSAIVIDVTNGEIVYEMGINFGKDLPEYNCPNGFLENEDPLTFHSDPLMWAAAIDLLFSRMKADGFDFAKVKGLSGSGQQHGSVYLKKDFLDSSTWNWSDGLAAMVKPMLSRPTSPIWMDSSTTAECKEITEAVGSAKEIRTRTGSAAIERFTGPQIRKFFKNEPSAYENTGVIHLVSSFLCSLMAGKSAAIDPGDGAGMNLLNLSTLTWDEKLLAATADNLSAKLPEVVAADQEIGRISPYFVEKYGFHPDTSVTAWSGDNPNSLIGVGGYKPGVAVVSLGTSDTFFAAMAEPVTDPDGYGHVFGNPAGGFMCLICFKNGSLAREKVKEQYDLNWKEFDETAFRETPAGNNNNMMLPYFESEITPVVLNAGVIEKGPGPFNAYTSARAVVEAQAMRMKIHSNWIGSKTERLRLTGGGSKSFGICQTMADVFDATVERLETGNSAGLGAAMRAANATGNLDWQELTEKFCKAVKGKDVFPISENTGIYNEIISEFEEFEKAHL